MSQENVEVIERLLERPSDPAQDLASLFRNDAQWQAWIEEFAPFFHPDWETLRRTALGDEGIHTGFEGSRSLWLGWLKPWESYRVVIERVIDCGERVVALSNDHARPWDSTERSRFPHPLVCGRSAMGRSLGWTSMRIAPRPSKPWGSYEGAAVKKQR